MEHQILTSLYAVVTDWSFYAGIVVGACSVLSYICISATRHHNAGWRYMKTEDNNNG